MAIPSGTIPVAFQNAAKLRNTVAALARESESIKNECLGGVVKLHDLVSSRLQALINYKEAITTLSAEVGVGDAYTQIFSDYNFVFVDEIADILDKIQALINYIVTQIPKSGSYLNTLEFDADYMLVQRTTMASVPISNLQNMVQQILDVVLV